MSFYLNGQAIDDDELVRYEPLSKMVDFVCGHVLKGVTKAKTIWAQFCALPELNRMQYELSSLTAVSMALAIVVVVKFVF